MSIFSQHKNLDRVTVLSVGFLMVFIAFNSAANLSGQALTNDGLDNLGFLTSAFLYLVFAFTSFFAAPLVTWMGPEVSLFVGGLCYSFWVLCFIPAAFYPDHKDDGSFLFEKSFIYGLSFFSSAVNGVGAGILWVA